VLQSAYAEISRKQISHTQLHLNRSVICDFHYQGFHILNAIEWDSSDADLIIYSDMFNGLGFAYLIDSWVFVHPTPNDCPCPMIFYFEALMITSAIIWASGLSPIHCLLVYSDSLNCIEMFNTFSTQDGYNELQDFIVHILMSSNISLHVFHIPSTDNITADALSHHLPGSAAHLLLGLQIHHFQPVMS